MGVGLKGIVEQLPALMAALELSEMERWLRYRSDGDPAARDWLFLHHSPWAASIAGHVYSRVRAYQVDREDFVQNATIGLLEAMSRYDPARGIPFRSYARARVRGAVFNGLRAILGDRSPSGEAKLAERLHTLRESRDDTAFDGIINDILNLGLGYLLDEVAASSRDACYSEACSSQIELKLRCAVRDLPGRLQMIVHAHYFQHVPFQEIAAKLKLTKGRVSQLHKDALIQLRTRLREIDVT